MKKTYRISELTGRAHDRAVKDAARELNEAFHFNIDAKDVTLVEETADDFGLRYTAAGTWTI